MAMRKPGGGRNMRDADARASAEVRSKLSGSGDDAGGDDDGDDDDDDGGSGGSDEIEVRDEPSDDGDLDVGAPPQPTPREQRRRERQTLRQEAEELRGRVSQYETQLAELQRRVLNPPAPAPQQQPTNEPDPLDAELRATRAEMRQLEARWKRLTPAEQAAQHAKMLEEQEALNDKEQGLVFRINQKKYGGGGGVSHEEVAAHARDAALKMQYPDVAGHAKAWGWAVAMQRAEIDAAGGPSALSQAQIDRITQFAILGARKRFGLGGGAPAPTQQQQARFTGTSTGGGGGARAPQRNGNGGGGPSFKVSRGSREGKMMLKMAVSAYPHIARSKGEEAALKHWMKEVGPSVARELAKGGKG